MVADRKKLQFPQLRISSQRRLDGGVVLDGAIQNAHHALLEGRQRLNDQVAEELGIPFDEVPPIPGGARFGSLVQVVETGAGVQLVDAGKVNERVQNQPPDGSIPTADQILYTSYKTGGKCIIRIEKQGEDENEGIFFEHFSLQSVSEPQEQRLQVHELFDGEKIFFFGRRPRFWTYSGVVRNAKDSVRLVSNPLTDPLGVNPQRVVTSQSFADKLIRLFQERFAGTKAVENLERVILTYEDIVVEGLMTNMLPTRNSQIPSAVNITFTLFVTNSSFIGSSADGESLSDVIDEFKRQSGLLNSEPSPGLISAPVKGAESLEEDKRKAEEEENFTAAEVQAAVQEEQALLGQILDHERQLDPSSEGSAARALADAEAALAEREAEEAANPGSVDPYLLSLLRNDVKVRGRAVDVVTADKQGLEQRLGVVTADLANKATDKQIAEAKGEYATQLIEHTLTEEDKDIGINAGFVPEALANRILADGGEPVSAVPTAFDQETFIETGRVQSLKITIRYPEGKRSNRKIKLEDVVIRVRISSADLAALQAAQAEEET